MVILLRIFAKIKWESNLLELIKKIHLKKVSDQIVKREGQQREIEKKLINYH